MGPYSHDPGPLHPKPKIQSDELFSLLVPAGEGGGGLHAQPASGQSLSSKGLVYKGV